MFAGIFGLFFLLLAIAAFIFWIWMLVDCIKNTRLGETEKVVWVLVIIFLHALGALIYLLAGRDR
jgi:hypothetical protein